jgi:hypothetical protein
MKLRLERRWPKATYTIGRLYVDGVYFCNTLEDKDRGLKQTDSKSVIASKKIFGETAIPKGEYSVVLNVLSPKYAGVSWYKQTTGGYMPRLLSVPGFDGILIHPGNTAVDTLGCILVGKNTQVGRLTQSKDTFAALYKKMKAAWGKGEGISIEII